MRLVLIFTLFGSSLFAVSEEADIVKKVRADLIARAKEAKPYAGRDWYLKIISDDSAPFPEQDVFNQLRADASDEATGTKSPELLPSAALLPAILFRWRDRPDLILKAFDALTFDERVSMCLIFGEQWKPLLNAKYFPLFKRVIMDALKDITDRNKTRAERDHAKAACLELLNDTFKCDAKQAAAFFEEELKWIAEPQYRSQLALSIIPIGGRPVLPIAQWYLDQYCIYPWEAKLILDYLKKNMPDVELKTIIQQKQDMFRETIDVLSGKETKGTANQEKLPAVQKKEPLQEKVKP